MESAEAAKKKVVAIGKMAASTKILVYEVEEWASKEKLEFQQTKRCVNAVIEEVIRSGRGMACINVQAKN